MADDIGRNERRYRQIADALRARIASGEFGVGDKLPSIDALHAQYSAATETVRRALEVLREEGLAETFHGTGSFVRAPGPRRSPEYLELERRLDVAEARQEATEMDVMELHAKLGYEQPSHQQDGSGRRARHEDVG